MLDGIPIITFRLNRNKQSFSFRKRIESFSHAFSGLQILLKEKHNLRIHLFASVFVVVASFVFKINKIEWLFIIFSIGLVIIAETINTAIENMYDFISPEKHELIKKIKDISAAAVLLASIFAGTIGIIVFLPKI